MTAENLSFVLMVISSAGTMMEEKRFWLKLTVWGCKANKPGRKAQRAQIQGVMRLNYTEGPGERLLKTAEGESQTEWDKANLNRDSRK